MSFNVKIRRGFLIHSAIDTVWFSREVSDFLILSMGMFLFWILLHSNPCDLQQSCSLQARQLDKQGNPSQYMLVCQHYGDRTHTCDARTNMETQGRDTCGGTWVAQLIVVSLAILCMREWKTEVGDRNKLNHSYAIIKSEKQTVPEAPTQAD